VRAANSIGGTSRPGDASMATRPRAARLPRPAGRVDHVPQPVESHAVPPIVNSGARSTSSRERRAEALKFSTWPPRSS